MKIAMFGGSFNPVHNGHVRIAATVHEQAGYDKVLFVPAFHSPFKNMPSGATDEDRLNMLELAVSGFEWASVEDCEIKRGGVSYTYDTVSFLDEKFRVAGLLSGKLGLVIGEDLVEGFPRWYKASELAEKVDIILAKRSVAASCTRKTVLPFVHLELENPYVDVSSSEVRDSMKERSRLRALVPEKVYEYILRRRLYD
ncbi:MAG: nicotinate (nicotinamide) nucleotide adenylyltransferase [Treponemataceae bacterium]|nr:nicotinate (nicotinamide) nucleotide adenylyltransferase [Treponemataceae bacterium]